jgi:hypothetical protein
METRDVPLEIATDHDTKCPKRDKRAKRDKRDKRAKCDKRDKRDKRAKRDKRDKNRDRDRNLRQDRFLKHLAGLLDQQYQRMLSLESEQEEECQWWECDECQWWECDECHNFGANLPSAEQERLWLEAEGSDDEGNDDWKNCQDPTCRWPDLCQFCW